MQELKLICTPEAMNPKDSSVLMLSFECCCLFKQTNKYKHIDMVSIQKYCNLVTMSITVNYLFGMSGLEYASMSPCPVCVIQCISCITMALLYQLRLKGKQTRD